jgi:hypothetical protein
MSYSKRLYIITGIMLSLSWIDNKYITQPPYCRMLSDDLRWVLHLGVVGIILIIGLFFWTKNNYSWVRNLWLISNIFAIIILAMLAIIYHFKPVYSTNVVMAISRFRTFFTSPVPFLLLYVVSKIGIIKEEEMNKTGN